MTSDEYLTQHGAVSVDRLAGRGGEAPGAALARKEPAKAGGGASDGLDQVDGAGAENAAGLHPDASGEHALLITEEAGLYVWSNGSVTQVLDGVLDAAW